MQGIFIGKKLKFRHIGILSFIISVKKMKSLIHNLEKQEKNLPVLDLVREAFEDFCKEQDIIFDSHSQFFGPNNLLGTICTVRVPKEKILPFGIYLKKLEDINQRFSEKPSWNPDKIILEKQHSKIISQKYFDFVVNFIPT